MLISCSLQPTTPRLMGRVSDPIKQQKCCGPYRAVLTEYRIKGEMWKAGWFSQERSVKECEGVWWNVVVVTPDHSFVQRIVLK